jgi:flagellar FliJ protein
MGYRFKLEALKRFRQFQEERCQKELSEAQRIWESENRILLELIESRSQTEAELKRQGDGEHTGPGIVMYTRYLERIARQIEDRRSAVSEATAQCDRRRRELVAAMQKRKTLETLKEHGLEAYLRSLNQEEEKFINEMAINRYILNSR